MKTYSPNYYNEFKCIADRCRHSCCVGWDVYIDDASLELYQSDTSGLADEILSEITITEDGACFIATEDKKCPFLNSNGLCNIICKMGETYLCEICREHPRFYNCFSDRYEVGLGLCCEEAARIILSQQCTTTLEILCDDELDGDKLTDQEKHIIEKRRRVFDIIQDRTLSLEKRTDQISSICNFNSIENSTREWADELKKLERLDTMWEDALTLLEKHGSLESIPEFEIPFEKLILYFIYRHTSSAESLVDFDARAAFAVFSYKVILGICNGEKTVHGSCTFEKLCDIARMYSCEIEYSEENTFELISKFTKQ